MQLISGQKIALNQLIENNQTFSLKIQVNAEFDVHISSFGLNVSNQLASDDYMTFYNQPQTPHGEVTYQQKSKEHIFQFNLQYVNEKKLQSLSCVQPLVMRVRD